MSLSHRIRTIWKASFGMKCYIAGPMRGYDLYNFPAFDAAQEWLEAHGWDTFSPAADDRAQGLDEHDPVLPEWFSIEHAMNRDLAAVIAADAIVLLPGWQQSSGARKEATVAVWTGKDILYYDPTAPRDRLVPLIYPPGGSVLPKSVETRVVSETGGAKGTKRARFDLIPPDAWWAIAEHFGRGAEKYEDRNWEKGYNWSLSYAALLRHLTAWWGGEDSDPDITDEEVSHLVAVAWHALVLLHNVQFRPEYDDRPEPAF